MSTQASTAELFPTWKQEINRRVAAHMRSNRAPAGRTGIPSEGPQAPASRAAQAAAARVAARFAHAPSYNEALADYARAAVRAAKAASRAAQEAHAAAQYVLEGLEAVSSAEPDWNRQIEPERVPGRHAGPAVTPAPHNPPGPLHFHQSPLHESPLFTPRLEPELPLRPADPAPALHHRPAIVETGAEAWREPDSPFPGNPGVGDIHTVEPDQPIYANLIQFHGA